MEKDIIYLLNNKYYGLSKTFKKIADYTKEEYLKIPFLSIKELAELIDISTASITRFSQELGFSGYPEFQKQVQLIVEKEILHMKEIKKSISKDGNNDELLKKMFDLNVQSIEESYTEELNESFKQSIQLMNKANKIYIIGLRSSYTAAYYLDFMLSQFMDNVELVTLDTGNMFNKLINVNSDDILLSISFAQCTKQTIEIVDYFKSKGCKIIALTDSKISPTSERASVSLIVKNTEDTFSFVSALSICNTIVVRMGKENKEQTIKRIEQQEMIAIENGIYYIK